jgi:transposase InsO family protein
MGHPNAPLTPQGRRRLCERVASGRPVSHVAAEAGVSRQCLAKWYARWLADGEAGLRDRSSVARHRPNRTPVDVELRIVQIRRALKYGPSRIAAVLADEDGERMATSTVHRVLVRHGLNRLRDMDPPTGERLRAVQRFEHSAPGSLVHVDVKKLGRIPTGGGWWAHGIGTSGHRASKRRGQGTGAVGYTYLHSALDDHSRLAYTEALDDERGRTAAGFWLRAASFFAAHGITLLQRCLTDNGACYRSRSWAESLDITSTAHKRTRPYRPQTNGKIERFNGTLSREWAYVREYNSETERRAALIDFLNHYNYERPHSAIGHRPPASRVPLTDYRLSSIALPPSADGPRQLTFDDLTA